MAKANNGLPDTIQRRELLYGKEAKKANHAEIATRYLEAGRLMDALEFAGLAHDETSVGNVAARAIEGGDAFMLAQVERVTKTERDPGDWKTLANNAEKADKTRYAIDAFRRAGDLESVKRLGGEVDEDEADDGRA